MGLVGVEEGRWWVRDGERTGGLAGSQVRGESGLLGRWQGTESLAGIPGWVGGGSGWMGPGGHCWAWLGSWLGVLGEDGRAPQGLAGIASGRGSWEVGQAGGRRGESLVGMGWDGCRGGWTRGPSCPCVCRPHSPLQALAIVGTCCEGRMEGARCQERSGGLLDSPCRFSSFITLSASLKPPLHFS